MKYTQIPTDTFEHIQLNAGILCSGFTPETGEVKGLLGATTGGIAFKDSPEYVDFGEDIDNCPKNTKELKKVDSREVTMSGTFVTVTAASALQLAGAADSEGQDVVKITPRDELKDKDFTEVWFVGDYSDKNTGATAGFIAIRLLNALNTGGFQIQTEDKSKGQFAFDFAGHYSITNMEQVPYELYIKEGA